jgi:hypothetical protein
MPVWAVTKTKNFMKKVKNSFMVLIAAIATLGVVTSTTQKAQAQGGVEDTWSASAGDCVGSPTDCLDTIVISFQ